ncbi:DUF2752 domain-containing protein [Streptacidiphilus jiangxiensis]|uniref:DUF2752 domain-containing protein n=1 Tax=Streptacidiphilus jiangxiensis TaxID=235985 RepID=UPI00191BE399|nr:DUF2752 domain-containing protein [Streptacidiphilus jiangxiensis]
MDTGAASADQAVALDRRALWERRWASVAAGRHGGPLRVLLRGAGAAVVAIVAAEVHRTHDPGVLCPLRRFTGVPCPLCGSTTVFMELGAGHVGAAIAANPVTVLAGLCLLFAPLGGGARWQRLSNRSRLTVIIPVLLVSWLWQLHRFDFLPS